MFACLMICSCKKDDVCEGCQTNPPINQPNIPPVAFAGVDQTIDLPKDSVQLYGTASNDPDGKLTNYKWSKISGPSSFIIVNADSVLAKATHLVKGVYHFELTVTDSLGLMDKDTVIVTVRGLFTITNEVIFTDQSWMCDYEWCWITIPNIFTYLPSNIPFKVFIKRDNASAWVEAGQDFYEIVGSYSFWISYDGHLEFYTYAPFQTLTDSPDIKIIY
jgi:hypothetical protein